MRIAKSNYCTTLITLANEEYIYIYIYSLYTLYKNSL